MSDSAFKSRPFPSFTTAELIERVAGWEANNVSARAAGLQAGVDVYERMKAEIERRAKRDAGEVSVMSDGEHLRHVQQSVKE